MLDNNIFAFCLNIPVNYKFVNGNAPSMSRKDEEAFILVSVLIIAITSSQSNTPVKHASTRVCKDEDEARKYTDSVGFIDKRIKGTIINNNFEVVDSCNITSIIQQIEVCQTIIDYNKNNPDDSGWDRDIVTMLVEWDWHNDLAPYIENGCSVNFDMGQGTDSTDKSEQMWGWVCEKIKSFF